MNLPYAEKLMKPLIEIFLLHIIHCLTVIIREEHVFFLKGPLTSEAEMVINGALGKNSELVLGQKNKHSKDEKVYSF